METEEGLDDVVVGAAVLDQELSEVVHRTELGDDVSALSGEEDEATRDLGMLDNDQRGILGAERFFVEAEEALGLGDFVEGPDAAVEGDGGLALHEDVLEGERVRGEEPQEVAVFTLGAGKEEGA